ncbi:MAG TPA: type II toxin-antitoxin system Phd/YefM family antitoxin [Thermoanaerobaculia bacterium]|nr:type II toxin-antitoxin system Phd/YefM family antitoxin [Thermoanaerobaculia bacterium]
MKKGTQTLSLGTRRLGVAEAKSKLSEVLREAAQGPTIIHSRGRDLVVVLAIEDYERLTADQHLPRAGGATFLQRVEALKQRYGGGVSDFEPARLDFVPAEPFAQRRTVRG